MKFWFRITGNVHIEHHPHLWSGAGDATLCCRCASCRSLSPNNAIYLAGTGRAGPYLYGSNAVSCGSVGGVLTQEETVLQISTCSGKLSIKAVLLEITTKKWYIEVRQYMIHRLAAKYRSLSVLLRVESCN